MRLLGTPDRPLSADGLAIARSLRDSEAFSAVFDRHFASVYRYLARRARRDVAEDLASQTFMLAFAHRGQYRDDLRTARPWLFGIATNLLRAEHRVQGRRQVLIERLQSDSTSAQGQLGSQPDDHALEGDLGQALAELQEDQREALLLHVWGEMSYPEIAAALKVPVGTVRSRISRACAALRLELTPPAPVGEGGNHA